MRSILLFFTFLMLFLSHRLLIAGYLGLDLIPDFRTRLSALFLGTLSDFWVASLFSLLSVGILRPFFLAALSVVIASHVVYVEHYKHTIRLVHLPYLTDWDFMRASATELRGGIFFVQLSLAIFFVAVYFTLNRKFSKNWKNIFPSLLLVGLGVGANSYVNIATAKFNLSSNLVLNPLVNLANQIKDANERALKLDLSKDELKHFKLASCNAETLRSILAPLDAPGIPMLKDLQPTIQARLERKEPVYFLLVLMESTRAIDSHLYFPEIQGHTPELDKIARDGMRFSHGYSLSRVSRAAGEGTVCNSWASIYYNAMRNTPEFQPLCAKELLVKPLSSQGISSRFQWFHGGYQSFDSQNNFWTIHDFLRPLDILSYDPDAPRTEWGLSDQVLFKEVVKNLKNPSDPFQFAVISTISNHYNWQLPPDASEDLKRKYQDDKIPKNFVTLEYQDQAIGNFVREIKERGIWDQAIVMFVGDHGMEEPSAFHDQFRDFGDDSEQNAQTAKILSHVYFTLSGGSIETMRCPECNVIDHPVSQADVLPTFMALAGVSQVPLLGNSLFSAPRKRCVFSDLGEVIVQFSSEKVTVKKRHDFFQTDAEDPCVETQIAYKLYLNLLQSNENILTQTPV